MNEAVVVTLAKDTIEIILLLSLPVLGVGLVVGLLVSVFQAATQIQEMTLTFVPKIIAMLVSLLFLIPWMMAKLTFFTEQLIVNIPHYVR